jgi:DNA mismatch repair protein MutL
MSDNLSILNCPASNDLKTTVFHIYGKKIAKFMEPINYEDASIRIEGLLGHSQISRNNRSQSSIFLNNRYVISDLLHRAIQEAYVGTLMIGRYPFFILQIHFDPAIIDFNVHPKKLHVRFEDEEFVYNKVYTIIRDFVKEHFIEKEDKYTISEISDFISPSTKISRDNLTVDSDGGGENTEASQDYEKTKISSLKPVVNKSLSSVNSDTLRAIKAPVQLKLNEESSNTQMNENGLSETYLREKYILKKNFPKLRLISSTGQLSNNIYIVLEGINENGQAGLYILDQHAASERVKKEYFYNIYNTTRQIRQTLISPLKIDVTPSEKFFLQSNLTEFKKLGFNFDHFGGNTFILREIPTIINKLPNPDVIKEIIGDVTEIGKDKSFSEVREEIINYLACHRSIRGGDALTLKEIRKLIIDLSYCKDPYHCAHGRPTLKFISFKELDKLFKRIV